MRLLQRMIHFLCEDIKKNKLNFVFGVLQITLVMLLLGYMIDLGIESYKTIERCTALKEQGNMYQVECIAESGHINKIINDEASLNRFGQFYQYLDSIEDMKYVTADSSLDIWLTAYDADLGRLADVEAYGVAEFPALRVSNSFFDFYGLDVEAKSLKNFNAYNGGEEVPVILGHGFKPYYALGDVFTDSGDRPYRIVGFFKKNERYVAPFESKSATPLDNMVVVPVNAEPIENGIGCITVLSSTYFITDDEKVMEKIVQKSNDFDLLPLDYRTLDEQITYVIEDLQNEAITMGSILLLILTFAAAGMISYMVRFIQLRLREFSIHMLCGADFFDIILRIVSQLCLILCIADVFVIGVFDSVMVVAGTIVLSFVYGMGIILYPIWILKQNQIIDIIRRN